jgi:hypothetical protein
MLHRLGGARNRGRSPPRRDLVSLMADAFGQGPLSAPAR